MRRRTLWKIGWKAVCDFFCEGILVCSCVARSRWVSPWRRQAKQSKIHKNPCLLVWIELGSNKEILTGHAQVRLDSYTVSSSQEGKSGVKSLFRSQSQSVSRFVRIFRTRRQFTHVCSETRCATTSETNAFSIFFMLTLHFGQFSICTSRKSHPTQPYHCSKDLHRFSSRGRKTGVTPRTRLQTLPTLVLQMSTVKALGHVFTSKLPEAGTCRVLWEQFVPCNTLNTSSDWRKIHSNEEDTLTWRHWWPFLVRKPLRYCELQILFVSQKDSQKTIPFMTILHQRASSSKDELRRHSDEMMMPWARNS